MSRILDFKILQNWQNTSIKWDLYVVSSNLNNIFIIYTTHLSLTLGLGEKKKSTSGLPFTKERNRENEKDPGKWTQNRIGKKSQAVPLDQISSKPNFEILQDEGLVTPSKSNHHGNFLIFF